MTSMDGGFRRREYGHYVYEAALISNKAEVYSPFTNEELVGEVLKPFSNEVVIAFFHKQVNQTILVRI